MPEGVRVGIVGATTLAGKEVIEVLRDRGVLVRDLVLLSTEADEEGALAEAMAEPTFVSLINREELDGLDIVFFCGSASSAIEWIELRHELDFLAINLTSRDSRVDGPRVLAGVTELEGGSLAVSPHPIAVAAGLVLASLSEAVEIESFRLNVVQPASELGQEGIDEMYEQTLAVLNVQSTPREVFEHQVAFNLYTPSEAELIEREVRDEISETTGLDGSVMIQQGGTFHSHTASMFVAAKDDLDLEVVRDALDQSAFLTLSQPDDLTGTSDAGGLDEVVVGRVSVAAGQPRELLITFFSDNLRRSRAINAVMIAEQYIDGSTITN